MYRALRPAGRVPLQIAPIAAKFERCREVFERLCIIIRSMSPEMSSAVEDVYGRFLAWGNDSGASSRALDHTLQKSSSLQDMTTELLISLYSKLNEGELLCFTSVTALSFYEKDNGTESSCS
jgi:hypothetical protein